MRASQYSSKKVIFLGLVHFVLGALSIALGIASATPTEGSFPYGQIGYGIWGGVLYIVNGILAVAAGAKRSPDLIVSHLALSIVVAVIASLEFGLGVASAVQDNALVNIREALNIVPLRPTTPRGSGYYGSGSGYGYGYGYGSGYGSGYGNGYGSGYGSGSGSGSGSGTSTVDPEVQRYYDALRTFYGRYGSYNMLSNLISDQTNYSFSNKLTENVHRGTVVVDCLLAITGILMALTAVLSSGSGCRVTCCSDLDMEKGVSQAPPNYTPPAALPVLNPTMMVTHIDPLQQQQLQQQYCYQQQQRQQQQQ